MRRAQRARGARTPIVSLRSTLPPQAGEGGERRLPRRPAPPLAGELSAQRAEGVSRRRPAGAPARDAILAEARAWLGTPYLHQASAKGQGTDCLGLVRGVWRGVYGAEPEIPPPYTPDWSERRFAAGGEPLIEAARRHLVEIAPEGRLPGDVLVFRILAMGPAKHCGIMSAPDRFIHAYAGRAVVEGWLNRWWLERLAGVFAFPGAEE